MEEESVGYVGGLEALTQEELAGYGSGQGVTAGMDSHPESIRTIRSDSGPFWLDRKVYVNQGYYMEQLVSL